MRISLPGPERTLTLAEVEVFSDGVNIAKQGSAAQSSVNWGGLPDRAVDGNRSGRWADGGQTHTLEDQPDPWWELDLGTARAVDLVRLWNRTDGDFGKRLDGVVVRLLGANHREVAQFDSRTASEQMDFEVAAGAWSARVRAIRALGALNVRLAETATVLVGVLDERQVARSAIEALGSVPAGDWTPQATDELVGILLDWAESPPSWMGDAESTRGVRSLAAEVAERLDPPGARELRRALRSLGPRAIVIRPLRHEMLLRPERDSRRSRARRRADLR